MKEAMVWSPNGPQGFESAKVRYEVLPYLAKGGLDIGCGPAKVWPHLIGIDSGKDTDLFAGWLGSALGRWVYQTGQLGHAAVSG